MRMYLPKMMIWRFSRQRASHIWSLSCLKTKHHTKLSLWPRASRNDIAVFWKHLSSDQNPARRVALNSSTPMIIPSVCDIPAPVPIYKRTKWWTRPLQKLSGRESQHRCTRGSQTHTEDVRNLSRKRMGVYRNRQRLLKCFEPFAHLKTLKML